MVGICFVLVIPVLGRQSDQGNQEPGEDDDEHSSDVLYGDPSCVLVVSPAVLPVDIPVPPCLLQALQLSVIEKPQNSKHQNTFLRFYVFYPPTRRSVDP